MVPDAINRLAPEAMNIVDLLVSKLDMSSIKAGNIKPHPFNPAICFHSEHNAEGYFRMCSKHNLF